MNNVFTVKNVVIFSIIGIFISNWYYVVDLFSFIDFDWLLNKETIFIVIRFLLILFLTTIALLFYEILSLYKEYISRKALFIFVLFIVTIVDLFISNIISFSCLSSNLDGFMYRMSMFLLFSIVTPMVLCMLIDINIGVDFITPSLLKKLKKILFKKGQLLNINWVAHFRHGEWAVTMIEDRYCGKYFKTFKNKQEAYEYGRKLNEELSNI